MRRVDNTHAPAASQRLRVIVLGYFVRWPVGGMAWHYLHYVLGLAELGHDVYFFEDSDDYPSCFDPSTNAMGVDPAYGLAFTREAFDRAALSERWAYYDAHADQWLGPCAERIVDICRTADVVLNVSGVNPMRPWFMQIPVRVLIDTDPVFTQIRHLEEPHRRELALKHTAFVTFGENFGLDDAAMPDDGFPWRATRQPIALQAWPMSPGPVHGPFTTVMQWNSYEMREHSRTRYGMKSESFRDYEDMPVRTAETLELAATRLSESARERLSSRGWRLPAPWVLSRTPWTYQAYIEHSKAEFTVAKHGYVVSRCGWFSERTACYLAAGRPAVVQETAFSTWLETGAGVVAFRTPEEAAAAIDSVNSHYEYHCRAARDIAEEYFASRKVLTRLLETVMHAPAEARAAKGFAT